MTVRIFAVNPSDSKQNPALITPFTGIHFLSGVAANFISRKINIPYYKAFIIWFLIHMFYEIKDLYYSYITKTGFDNSFINSVSDQVFGVLGFMIGQSLPIEIMKPFLFMFILIVVIAYIIKLP